MSGDPKWPQPPDRQVPVGPHAPIVQDDAWAPRSYAWDDVNEFANTVDVEYGELAAALLGAAAMIARLQSRLAEADHPHSLGYGGIDGIARCHRALDLLGDVMNAADAFLAEPPEDMQDNAPFNQYTTAGDCRALNGAYARVVRHQPPEKADEAPRIQD